MAEPAIDGRSLHPSFPLGQHSGTPSVVWVFSKSISYSSWVCYYISQDPLQLRYHMTAFWSIGCVDRSNANDFQDYSHKTMPHDPYFSFPMCQLDADDSAETFRLT